MPLAVVLDAARHPRGQRCRQPGSSHNDLADVVAAETDANPPTDEPADAA